MPFDEGMKLALALVDALDTLGHRAVADEPVWSSCPSEDHCADQIRARAHVEEVVLLHVLGGLTKTRVVAERLATRWRKAIRVELDLPRRLRDPGPDLVKLAGSLFPEGVVTAAFDEATSIERAEREPHPTGSAQPGGALDRDRCERRRLWGGARFRREERERSSSERERRRRRVRAVGPSRSGVRHRRRCAVCRRRGRARHRDRMDAEPVIEASNATHGIARRFGSRFRVG
jgi:hypothetical protein